MQNCVYGLANASRCWHLCVKEELVGLGVKLSSTDPGIFYWQDNTGLTGILPCHVDDMIVKELNILRIMS